jgi:glyoxalase family protein
MASPVTGIHHVTAIGGPAQANVDFYAGRLGLRFVKRTVNFDDPGTYHLYYADGDAHPGSFLTFFPYADAHPGRVGVGQATATAYAVPEGAADWWMDRFAADGFSFGNPAARFGRRILPFRDPDGLVLELVETPGATEGWADGPIPLDAALGAFFGVTLCVADPAPTARVLTDVLGYREAGEEGGRLRFENPAADRAAFVDLYCAPGIEPGRMGAGVVHHVAFRVPSDEAQVEVRETLLERGHQPTPMMDRQYFHSIYFREPGGVLFEVATDPPGFAVDEPADRLGTALKLPPQYEPMRAQIERRLPPLHVPHQQPA